MTEDSEHRLELRYKCLILDHDDTTVDSTRYIHYPAYCKSVREILGCEKELISLECWFRKNHSPGIGKFLDELFEKGKVPPEIFEDRMVKEHHIWCRFLKDIDFVQKVDFCPGMCELLKEFKNQGGLIVVVSHCVEEAIWDFYRRKGQTGTKTMGGEVQPTFLEPDFVFGWTDDPEKRKPNPYPCQEILRRFQLRPTDCLVVDDLLPGVRMARATSPDLRAVAAAWCNTYLIPEMEEELGHENVLRSVTDLRKLLYVFSE